MALESALGTSHDDIFSHTEQTSLLSFSGRHVRSLLESQITSVVEQVIEKLSKPDSLTDKSFSVIQLN